MRKSMPNLRVKVLKVRMRPETLAHLRMRSDFAVQLATRGCPIGYPQFGPYACFHCGGDPSDPDVGCKGKLEDFLDDE